MRAALFCTRKRKEGSPSLGETAGGRGGGRHRGGPRLSSRATRRGLAAQDNGKMRIRGAVSRRQRGADSEAIFHHARTRGALSNIGCNQVECKHFYSFSSSNTTRGAVSSIGCNQGPGCGDPAPPLQSTPPRPYSSVCITLYFYILSAPGEHELKGLERVVLLQNRLVAVCVCVCVRVRVCVCVCTCVYEHARAHVRAYASV